MFYSFIIDLNKNLEFLPLKIVSILEMPFYNQLIEFFYDATFQSYQEKRKYSIIQG